MKPTLKAEVKKMFVVRHFDLEEFIKKVTGINFEFAPDQECANDSSVNFMVDGRPTKHQKNVFAQFKKQEFSIYMASSILECLCEEGYIEPGEYVIRVSW